jgi:SAM-dependent methyltransferase
MTEPRFTFDEIAADYDARRPDYPAALFDDLAREAPPDARVLEVGCGTGKATEGLARTGRDIFALDPGANMLAQARRRLSGFANIRFAESTFEAWAPAQMSFELICAAQAWHWVDPAVGYAKAARLLSPTGRLAIFGNVQARPPEPFRSNIAFAFDAAFGRAPGGAMPDTYAPGGRIPAAFAACGLFEMLPMLHYERAVTVSAESFVGLVATFSDTRMLPEPARDAFLRRLGDAIDAAGGAFETTLETYCHVGRPRP